MEEEKEKNENKWRQAWGKIKERNSGGVQKYSISSISKH